LPSSLIKCWIFINNSGEALFKSAFKFEITILHLAFPFFFEGLALSYSLGNYTLSIWAKLDVHSFSVVRFKHGHQLMLTRQQIIEISFDIFFFLVFFESMGMHPLFFNPVLLSLLVIQYAQHISQI
jgi:hypothetical protein